MFNPFFRTNTIDRYGIPVLKTTAVTTDTTNSTVTYSLCHNVYRRLPCSGLFVLQVVHVPSGTTTGYAVNLSTGCLPKNTLSTVTTVTTAKPLVNGSGT